MLPYRYRVVKYDEAQRFGEVDAWISMSDIGSVFEGVVLTEAEYLRVEQAHLDTVRDAAEVSGVDSFELREPRHAQTPAHHDGAVVTVAEALEILRGLLREDGFDCRLEAPGRMYVHVGYDYYLYVGSCVPCAETLASHGLYVDEMTSPQDPEADVQVEYRPADDVFFQDAVANGPAWLQEWWCGGRSRWHRLTGSTVEDVRARLVPRAVLTVYAADSAESPDPETTTGVTAALPDPDGIVHLRGHRWGPEFGYRVARSVAVEAMRAFAAECAVTELAIREPAFLGATPDPAWYDGAVRVIDELDPVVAAILAGTFWCRLELRDELYVHIGREAAWIGTRVACPETAAKFGALQEDSPLSAGHVAIIEYRTADDLFWHEVEDAVVVEEEWAHGALRVHDLAARSLNEVRAALLPRSVVRVHRSGEPIAVAALPDADGALRLRHEPHRIPLQVR